MLDWHSCRICFPLETKLLLLLSSAFKMMADALSKRRGKQKFDYSRRCCSFEHVYYYYHYYYHRILVPIYLIAELYNFSHQPTVSAITDMDMNDSNNRDLNRN